MRMRAWYASALIALMSAPTIAKNIVLLHAGGSLRGALTDIATRFEAAGGGKAQAEFGASGWLKDEIVFASANMEHPQALADAKRSGPAVL
jgi:molybdate transport system substrate-binding protein